MSPKPERPKLPSPQLIAIHKGPDYVCSLAGCTINPTCPGNAARRDRFGWGEGEADGVHVEPVTPPQAIANLEAQQRHRREVMLADAAAAHTLLKTEESRQVALAAAAHALLEAATRMASEAHAALAEIGAGGRARATAGVMHEAGKEATEDARSLLCRLRGV